MKRIKRLAVSIIFLSLGLLCAIPAAAGQNEKDNKAILLVTFGTSVQSAMPAYNNLEQAVQAAFPGVEVRWAYTSKIIRDKLAARDGRLIDDPFTALSKLKAEGYDRIVVQSDHIFAGQEYNDLMDVLDNFLAPDAGKFGPRKISLGRPLLYQHEDYVNTAKALAAQFPADTGTNAVILMGHGSKHPADSAYGKLNDILRHMYKNVFLGTVEGYPTLEEVKEDLAASGTKKVTLMPLMNIAGDHTVNDLYGDEEDSWKSQLNKSGYETEGYLKGLLENRAIVNIFVAHLAAAMAELEEEAVKDAEVRVNGEKIKFSEPPRAGDGFIMAQLRPIFEAMGCTVSWAEDKGTVIAEKTGLALSFRQDSAYVSVNGAEVVMENDCRLVNGSLMLPLSFLNEHLGYSVNWDLNGNIKINKK